MQFVETRKFLTHKAALAMLNAAADAAEAMGQPQCIVIVDASGEVLAELRMTGSKFLSRRSALAKAQTAASIGKPSSAVPEAVRLPAGIATSGSMTSLPGGLPIVIDGDLVGGIGVGSGTSEQDVAIAKAALAAIGADAA